MNAFGLSPWTILNVRKTYKNDILKMINCILFLVHSGVYIDLNFFRQNFRWNRMSLSVLLILCGTFKLSDAGTCWVKRLDGGRCKQPLAQNVSRAECCAAGIDVGYTDSEMNPFQYMISLTTGSGSGSCQSCIDSCDAIDCGPNKRCIIKFGQRKCVCAIKCRTSKHPKRQHNSLNKTTMKKSVQLDGVINSRNPTVEMVARPCSEYQNSRNGKIISIVDSTMHDCNSMSKGSNGNCTTTLVRRRGSHESENEMNGHRRNLYDGKSGQRRRNTTGNGFMSMEDRIRLKFFGYDMPYPPVDFANIDGRRHQKAVCGSDGRSYKSECQMRKRACRLGIDDLRIAYKGHCQTSCANVICPAGQHCLEDQNLMPHCISCMQKCPPFEIANAKVVPSKMVCGTDGKTYRNMCEIKRTACLLTRSIPVAYRGPCKDAANCDNIKCKDRQKCLIDFVTHRPRCLSCNFNCPHTKRPQGQKYAHIKLCGVNNITYHSWCHMMLDSCKTGHLIDVKHNGECE